MAKTQPRGGQILDNTIKLDTPEQDVTGVLPVGNGGTGKSSITNGSLIVGDGSGGFSEITPDAEDDVLTVEGGTWVSKPATNGVTEDLAIAYAIAL